MDKLNRYFYEIFETLPRQGPGDRDATLRALACLPPLTSRHRVLDIGCGSGAQTLDLARATDAHIVAVDNHGPFVDILAGKVTEFGLGHRVVPQIGDMADLRFPDEAFDVIWSEGAAFIIGFGQALSAWRRLLRPQGHMVISELCWLAADRLSDILGRNPPHGRNARWPRLDNLPVCRELEERRSADLKPRTFLDVGWARYSVYPHATQWSSAAPNHRALDLLRVCGRCWLRFRANRQRSG